MVAILSALLFAAPPERTLGVAITQAEGEEYGAAFEAARAAGMRSVSLPLKWADVEPRPGEYGTDPDWLAIARAFYAPQSVRCTVELNPVDTNNAAVPDDLSGRAWDDPELVRRYLKALDWVLDNLGELDVPAIVVGNEVDASLATDAQVRAYEALVRAAAERVKARRPDIPVGVKVTLGGLTGPRGRQFARLADEGGVCLVTYYPLEEDFTVRPEGCVKTDLDAALAALPGKPVIVAEIGCPSGAACGSSEERQAAFVREALAYWDAHADRIPLMEFTWLSDIAPAEVEQYAGYYGVKSPAFASYLATLGLRRRDGSAKPAYRALKDGAKRRGW